jgi:hypothetical protein
MIRDVYPGSQIRIFSIPYQNPALDFLPIPDPGVKKALDPGFATLKGSIRQSPGRKTLCAVPSKRLT